MVVGMGCIYGYCEKGVCSSRIHSLDEEIEGVRDYNSVATDSFFQKEVCERLCGIGLSEETY